MSAKLLNGKELAKELREELALEIKKLKAVPKLAVILVGDNPASEIYVRNKQKFAREVGIEPELIRLGAKTSKQKLMLAIEELNNNKLINGILVQLPLPPQLDEFDVINAISPEKDVDGFTVISKGLLSIGSDEGFAPCTPLGIIKMLEHYKINIDGKRAVVIGRSNIVGKPMAQMLLNKNATVTMAHSKTKNLKDITKEADIIVSAVGQLNLITAKHIKDGAVVIDVAMIRDEANKTWLGDVKFDEVSQKAKFITPVPGGVGPMTVACFLSNTLKAFKIQNNLKLTK